MKEDGRQNSYFPLKIRSKPSFGAPAEGWGGGRRAEGGAPRCAARLALFPEPGSAMGLSSADQLGSCEVNICLTCPPKAKPIRALAGLEGGVVRISVNVLQMCHCSITAALWRINCVFQKLHFG